MTSEERLNYIEKLLQANAEQVATSRREFAEELVASRREFDKRLASYNQQSEEQFKKRDQEIEKINDATRGLIAVARTVLDSIKEDRARHERDYEEMRAQSKATEEKLNILVETVDRIIRQRNGRL
ncbi:MAG TPA: hypothetical protein VKY31_16055 [Terriglobia bacterium]|jgi:hypothetical protein|nr:hypothetical protein [Terriglobia bacterium]